MPRLPDEVLIEAKRQVISLGRQGKLLSPHDAWLLAGHTQGSQTLWSIARNIAQQHDVPADDLCEYLEKAFPQHTTPRNKPVHWDEIIHGSHH